MNYFKKVNPIYLILFIFLVGFFIFTPTKTVEAAAQCNAVPPYVTVTSEETMPAFTSSYVPWSISEETYTVVGAFPNYFTCTAACPGFTSGTATCSLSVPSFCSSSYLKIYTFKHAPSTTYVTSELYCTAGLPENPSAPGQYCVPTNAGCAAGYSTYIGDNNLGGGNCERVYSCTRRQFTGDYRYIYGSNCSGSTGSQPGCTIQSGTFGFCTFTKDVNSYYTESYSCPTSNPPSNVDVDATIWTSSARSTVFSSQSGDGPLWAYSQAPYRVSWGPVTDATSCTLNGSPASISGDSINTYTVPLNTTSIVYTLSCTGAGGTTSDTVTINIPPKPTNGAGSCPNPGTTGSFSWTAPGGYNTFITQARNDTTSTILGFPGTDSNFVGTTKNFTSTAGNAYSWTVNSKHVSTGAFSDPISGSFICTASASPDLTAGSVTPTTATAGTALTFSSTITNSGTGDTGASFNNFFRVATGAGGGGTVSTISVNSLAALNAGASGVVTSSSYTFPSSGIYYVQVCADNNASMVGTITESNEGNNCSAWTTVNVDPASSGVVYPSCDSTPWFTDSGAGTWSSRKIFQIDNGKVPTTLSGFPVLISTTTDYNLRSESYGGSVKDASGNDIAFTDSTGAQLAHEIEKYDPATGELIAWVRVPTLSSAADTKIYMYYGGSITTNQQDVAGTWSTNYRGVWHMGEATGANRVSSINSYAMVEDTGIDIAQATGKIGYAASAGTVNTNKRMQYLTSDLGISTNYTDSFWLKANTEISADVYRTVDRRDISTQIGSIIRYEYNSGTRRLVFQRAKLAGTIDAINHNITLGTAGWYHVAVTYNGTTLRAYLNGLEVGSIPASGNGVSGTSEGIATFARMGASPIDFAPITLDQISSSNTARSAEWIATEYNNQSVAPLGNFYGVSTHCPGANATASITANNQNDSITINSGESADLRWSYSNATSCTITPPPSNPSVYPNGSGGPVSTGALATSRIYTLSCNPGPVSDSVTVNVTPPVGTDYDLCIIKSGQGTISRDPLGTPSIPNCWTYADGENVTLTASIVPGRKFTGWGGDGASCAKNTTCNIIMDSAKSVIANFIVDPNYKEF